MHKPGNPQNYLKWMPVLIAGLGIIFMGFNLYYIIYKMANPT